MSGTTPLTIPVVNPRLFSTSPPPTGSAWKVLEFFGANPNSIGLMPSNIESILR